MNAETTNALTNALHAVCLLLYFVAAARAYGRKDERFPMAVVGFFLVLFVLKVMGVYVHHVPYGPGVQQVWFVIGALIILLHYLVLKSLRIPRHYRTLTVLFALGFSGLFVLKHDFVFLALPIVIIYLAGALWCRSLLRAGLFGVVGSGIVWIAARKGTELVIGGELPTAYRYDNDLFHFMLIASTFVVYKGFAKGDGIPEEEFQGESAVEEVTTG